MGVSVDSEVVSQKAIPDVKIAMDDRIDLRSDFLSRPTEAMIEAMFVAISKPPSTGRDEDPVVKKLESLAAEMLGKEEALFCPTCTMCNQIAVNTLCKRGDILLAPTKAHVLTSEGGAAAALSGVQIVTLETKRGQMSPTFLEAALIPEARDGRPSVGLILIENTHLRSGGCVVPESIMRKTAEIAAANGVPVHLDGSRMFNAAAFLGVEPINLACHADTVSISLNKGLSAPVGALLAGSSELIKTAVEIRQQFGGGWQSPGVLAAAGIVALEQMTSNLAADNENARKLAFGLNQMDGLSILNDPVETNVLLIGIEYSETARDSFLDRLAQKGVLLMPYDEGTIRAVVHKDHSSDDIDRVIRVIKRTM